MHPYRSAEPNAKGPASHFEDRVVFFVLLSVGLLGMALSFFFPERDVEGATGLVVVIFVLRARYRERRARGR